MDYTNKQTKNPKAKHNPETFVMTVNSLIDLMFWKPLICILNCDAIYFITDGSEPHFLKNITNEYSPSYLYFYSLSNLRIIKALNKVVTIGESW